MSSHEKWGKARFDEVFFGPFLGYTPQPYKVIKVFWGILPNHTRWSKLQFCLKNIPQTEKPNMDIKTMAPNYIPWGKPMGEFTNSASDLWKSTDQHRSSQLRGVAHQRFRFQSGRSKHLDQAGTHFSRGSLGKLAEAGSKLKANGSLKASSLVWDVRMGHEWDRIKIANQHQPT